MLHPLIELVGEGGVGGVREEERKRTEGEV